MNYKAFCLIIITILFSMEIFSQLPNTGFENWQNGLPDGWWANNVPGYVVPVTQSGDAHSGASAVKGEVVDFSGLSTAPILSVGSLSFGANINQRYKTFSGWHKFFPVGGDIIIIAVYLKKGDQYVANAISEVSESISSYKKFSIDFTYTSNEVPDKLAMTYYIGYKTPSNVVHNGSYFIVDDLSLDGNATSIKELKNTLPGVFQLGQNYPNPFNPTTRISFSIPVKSNVKLSVYNMIGQKVKDLLNSVMDAGYNEVVFNAGNLPSGIYIYKIETGNFIATKKMILAK